jgi:hypothetical protein
VVYSLLSPFFPSFPKSCTPCYAIEIVASHHFCKLTVHNVAQSSYLYRHEDPGREDGANFAMLLLVKEEDASTGKGLGTHVPLESFPYVLLNIHAGRTFEARRVLSSLCCLLLSPFHDGDAGGGGRAKRRCAFRASSSCGDGGKVWHQHCRIRFFDFNGAASISS